MKNFASRSFGEVRLAFLRKINCREKIVQQISIQKAKLLNIGDSIISIFFIRNF